MINGVPVAIKFEPRKTEAPQLRDEYKTYKILNGTPNIPYAYYFGQEGLHNILVIDLLVPLWKIYLIGVEENFLSKRLCKLLSK